MNGSDEENHSRKYKTRKERKELKDPFSFFKQAAAEAFGFLIDDYGFEKVSTKVQPPECTINFQNVTTGVTITYEWGGVIWIDLTCLRPTSAAVVADERYSVDVLMLECCPNRNVREFYPSDDESASQYVERVLGAYAHVLNECGRDIFRGDFQLFPSLKKHAEEILRQRRKEMFAIRSSPQ
jgi:hypothetical protein